jgi:hypothetical protein
MASVSTARRYRTGQKNPESGVYQFDGYLDGGFTPYPTKEERLIPLSEDETFPPIASAKKACYWALVYRT